MSIISYFIVPIAICFLGGCSIYPLPQDVTATTTQDIVQNIRCEARAGLRETIIEWLKTDRFRAVKIWKGYVGEDLAQLLEQHPEKWLEIKIKNLEKGVYEDFRFYENSQIAYEFSLNMEESNTDSFDLGFSRMFSRRKDMLGLSANASQKRNMTRVFNIVDTFSELALQVSDRYCNRPRQTNIIYPIAGKLPVKDLMHTYIYTNEFANLGGAGKEHKDIFGTKTNPAIPQMGDTITFTTKFLGSVNPTFALNPTGPGFLLASAGFKTEDYRQDMHQVLIVVSTSADDARRDPLDPTRAPPLPYDREAAADAPRPLYAKPVPRGQLTNARSEDALRALNYQRQKNVDDAIIQIGNSLSQLTQ